MKILPPKNVLYYNAHLVQVWDKKNTVVPGSEMSRLPVLRDSYLTARNGRIERYGPMSECPPPDLYDDSWDMEGSYLLPSWVDSHTHIVYNGSREEEFVDRIKGLSYEEIAANGGGILNSAMRLQFADEEELFEQAIKRVREVIGMGTGALEIKSGYGLTLESELKMLRVIRRIASDVPIPIKSTFLGAHAIPAVYKDNREGYIDLIINEMIPAVTLESLADYCDVFCEKGFFSVEESERIIGEAAKYGLKAKIHANELAFSGGVQLGVQMGAISVDHLECTGEEEIEALKSGKTLPTLLPGTSFFLKIPYAPARKLMEADLPVVLASDYNPGSSPSGNMPFIISLGCIYMQMLPEEAINAVTINAAAALELEQEYGTITRGKWANLIQLKKMPSLAYLPYAFGSNNIKKVFVQGHLWSGE